MKKIVLFLCVIGATAMMTSCFDRRNHYTAQGFVFVAVSTQVEPNVRYGRTENGNLITNQQIQQGTVTVQGQPIPIPPGSFFFATYMWDEENGREPLSNYHRADIVTFPGNFIPIPTAELNLTSTVPEDTPDVRYALTGVTRQTPHFIRDAWWWNDNWVFEFGYFGGEEPPVMRFYKREVTPARQGHPYVAIEIDVRIAEGFDPGTEALRRSRWHAVALCMASLREMYEGPHPYNPTNELRVTFNFYERVFDGQTITSEIRARSTQQVRWILNP